MNYIVTELNGGATPEEQQNSVDRMIEKNSGLFLLHGAYREIDADEYAKDGRVS